MSVNLVVEHLNKRHNISAGPLQTLSYVIQGICARIKPSPDPSNCILLLKGKPQDLSTPVRLLNLPSGTKLILTCGAKPIGGSQMLPNPGNKNESLNQKPGKLRNNEGDEQLGISNKERVQGDGVGQASGKLQEEIRTLGPRSEGWASLAGIEREFCVFHRDELLQSRADANWDQTTPDSFYDFTPEDYHRMMAEHKAAVDRQEIGLRTAIMREREEEGKAASLGPVNIRLVYPSGMICQAKFKATDKVGILYEFAASITECGRAGIVLYTTPPRFELKNEELSLYQAKLVPAANVYIGPAGGNQSLSNVESVAPKDEVICLREAPPNRPCPAKQDSANLLPDPPKPLKGKKKLQLPKWFKPRK